MNARAIAFAVVAFACKGAFAQSLYDIPRNGPSATQAHASVVFDKRTAADVRLRNSPTYVETIFVEGRNPDARPPRALEVRFADALTAPRSSPLSGINPLSDTPCMSLPSTWNGIGDAHVPLSGCPR